MSKKPTEKLDLAGEWTVKDVTYNSLTLDTCDYYFDGELIAKDGYVLIKGKRAKIIGRVCMDQMIVDVSDINGVSVGDTVTLFGRDGDEQITVDDLAKRLGTINYELVCIIGKRVTRVFKSGGETVAVRSLIG